MKMIVMRGVPGAGKSSKAKELVGRFVAENPGSKYHVCSADNYFINPVSGKYEFDAKKLSQAHAWCRGNANAALSVGVDLVVIDNTSTQKREFQPYIDMAHRFGYSVDIVVVGELDDDSLKKYANRNVHGVPLEAIRRMAKRFEVSA